MQCVLYPPWSSQSPFSSNKKFLWRLGGEKKPGYPLSTAWFSTLSTFLCSWEDWEQSPLSNHKRNLFSNWGATYKTVGNNRRPHCDMVPGLTREFGVLWKYRSSKGWDLARCKGHPAEAGSGESAVFSSKAPCLGHKAGSQPSISIWNWGMKPPGPWALTHQLPVMFPLTKCLGVHSITHFPSCPILSLPPPLVCRCLASELEL